VGEDSDLYSICVAFLGSHHAVANTSWCLRIRHNEERLTSRGAPTGISFSISFQHHFNRAGGRTSNVLQNNPTTHKYRQDALLSNPTQPQNKTGCAEFSVALVIIASCILGLMLVFVEFGMAFNASSSDGVLFTLLSLPLWILNPIGMIGWILHTKQIISANAAVLIFVCGSCVSGVGYVYFKKWITGRRGSK